MSDVNNLVEHLNNNAHDETYWLGACDESQVDVLEKKLVLLLPSDFKEFLLLVGGGGVIDEEISGIVDNDALADSGGAIYYDTCYCRDEYSLPLDMAVIYFKDDDVCWCIDCRKDTYGQVINYDLFSRKRSNIIASSFSDFFKEYVNLRT